MMFPFDQAALPQITPRRALIGVDFQNEFTSSDGALPVAEPPGYIDRTIQLASAVREQGGDVVWVRSRFEESRAVTDDKIIIGETNEEEPERPSARMGSGRGVPAALRAITAARRRDRASASGSIDSTVEAAGEPDEEAFLSKDSPSCLKDASSPASDFTSKLKPTMEAKDRKIFKSHYSAFNSTKLLHLLRASMVMEVFIVGSLTNVGVYATAMDAAGHGLSITIVEDCCGYRNEERHRRAIESLADFTGCEVASLAEVMEMIAPDQEIGKGKQGVDAGGKEEEEDQSRVSTSPGLVNPMTGLRLKSKSISPLDVAGDPSPPDEADSPSTSKLREATGTGKVNSADDAKADKKEVTDNPSSEELPLKKQVASSPPKVVDMPPHDHHSDPEAEPPPQKGLCEGDTDIIEDLLPSELETGIFDKLRNEVKWQRMSHLGGEVPRLVAVQGSVAEDGSIPVYRHPSDESPPLLPFSPTVLAIKAATEKHLGHPLNHCLIQYYRDGKDYISEHSDKTLDIVRDSYIANVSLGAERTMVLRTKRQDKDPSHAHQASDTVDAPKRQTQRARLPHNSLCRMGLKTNMKWLHSIRQDKRAEREKTPAELAFTGGRISLTFRRIGTFLSEDESMIWGQGATGKTREEARAVINGTGPEAIEMLKAFGTENHSSTFDWDARYGGGFDVLHMSSSPRFFTSPDRVVNLRIALMLAESGKEWAKGSMGPVASDGTDEKDAPVKFIDNDKEQSTVEGELAILLYLDAMYRPKPKGAELGKILTRFQEALTWSREIQRIQRASEGEEAGLQAMRKTLGAWNAAAAESDEPTEVCFVGARTSLVDIVVWPTLHSLVEKHGVGLFEGANTLKRYYDAFGARERVKQALSRLPAAEKS